MTTDTYLLDNPFFPFAEPFSVNVYLYEKTDSTNLDDEAAFIKARCAAGLELLSRIAREPDDSQEVFKMVLETGRELGVSHRPYGACPEPLAYSDEELVGKDLLATLSWLDDKAYRAAHYASLAALYKGQGDKGYIRLSMQVIDLASACRAAGMLSS